jgi:hypothetical protein
VARAGREQPPLILLAADSQRQAVTFS